MDILQELLEEASCNVNAYNYNGQSPIHTAASLNAHPQVAYFRINNVIIILLRISQSPMVNVFLQVLRTLLASCQHSHKDEKPHILNVDRPCVMEKSTAVHYAVKYQNLSGLR